MIPPHREWLEHTEQHPRAEVSPWREQGCGSLDGDRVQCGARLLGAPRVTSWKTDLKSVLRGAGDTARRYVPSSFQQQWFRITHTGMPGPATDG